MRRDKLFSIPRKAKLKYAQLSFVAMLNLPQTCQPTSAIPIAPNKHSIFRRNFLITHSLAFAD